MADTLRFVDAIGSSPNVRLDLNDDTTWGLQHEGTDLSPPVLRRAVADTLLEHGAHYPASAYEDRLLRLRLDLKTSTVDGSATELQKLMRELDRPSNILEWRPGTSESVFFRTQRSSAGRVVELPGTGTLRELLVEVLAEPFAYGTKQTLTQVTVNNDPAAGSNGMFFDVSDVKGDVETPLFLRVVSTPLNGGLQSLIAVRRRGTPSAAPFLRQAESASSFGTDTSLQANDAVMSGSGSNYVRCTFATATAMTARLAWVSTSANVDNRGTYRVFVRVRKSVSGDTITMQVAMGASTTFVVNDEVTLPSGTQRRWVDLGLVTQPTGPDPVTDGFSGSELEVLGQDVEIRAARSSGSGNLDIDAVLFVPADDRLCVIKWPAAIGATYLYIDPATSMLYGGADGEVHGEIPAELTGLAPMVSPDATNRIYMLADVGDVTSGGDDITKTLTVVPYYWPRYLYVRPATT